MRTLYAPLHPDLDNFLFAAVGEERDGIPLTVISALTGLGLDPWIEGTRLSSLTKSEAVAQMVLIINRLPGERWPKPEMREIALDLVELLPPRGNIITAAGARLNAPVKGAALNKAALNNIAPSNKVWLVCLIFAAAGFAWMAMSGALPFGDHKPPASVEAPLRSD